MVNRGILPAGYEYHIVRSMIFDCNDFAKIANLAGLDFCLCDGDINLSVIDANDARCPLELLSGYLQKDVTSIHVDASDIPTIWVSFA